MSDAPTPISLDSVKQAIADRQHGEVRAAAEGAAARYRFVKPLTLAADGLIEYMTNPEGRFMLGMHDVDVMTRGFGNGELVYVTGHSHSGKTQVIANGIANNRDIPILMFTPDEPAELVLSKLVSIRRGINAEEVEREVKAGNREMVDMVRNVAAHDFANLVVIDEALSFEDMKTAYTEAVHMFGGRKPVVVVDFLEQLYGDDGNDGVAGKSLALKRWTKGAANEAGEGSTPVICIHQRKRGTDGSRGKPAGMEGMRYGGENDAIFVLEVFRKREDDDLDPFERAQHQNTVTVNVCKNKRPPCKKGLVDLFMEPHTGRVRSLQDGDMRVNLPPRP